ncbi:multidrug effflux MFS transporter [Parvularcula flava]|uniref:Bcr/CflA family efflux transporter n=1 Tax=Aquisalinus luteolus TaxID=1566827 RepID=A0A8J3AB81_9PROT|nr:multidrug effflux MFS transporter [Aquisalinus luteolus]NHK29450.1 multidrug effflux MFS transporter [Aquisalinus luteolus]GGI01910.1 Bcr/CflA family drug resistance efflux transporter [Aquisalinus luteolus]
MSAEPHTTFSGGDASTGNGTTPRAGFREFVVSMAFLISLIAMGIDAMLPALGLISEDLSIMGENHAQFVVAILFAGMAFGQILFGPLSESTGRKYAVYIGLAVFVTGSLIAMVTPNFTVLLIARFMQGFGGAAGQIIAMAMVRDRYNGRDMARVLSLVMGVFILVPAVAPTIGQSILFIGDWRAIFFFLALQGLACLALLHFRIEETLPVERRKPYRVSMVLSGLKAVVTTPVTIGYTICAGCIFGGIIAYVSSAHQIFQEMYDTGTLFPLFFGMIALSIGVASFTNSTLVRKFGMRRLVATGISGIFTLTGLFLMWQLFVDATPPLALFVVFAMSTFFCFGMLFGNLNAMAMEPMGHIAGIAAAAMSCISTTMSVTIGTLIGQSFNGTVLPLTAGLFGLSILAACVMFTTEKLRGPEPVPQPGE